MADKDVHPHVTFTGNVTVNGPMFDIHDNQNVNIINTKNKEEKEDKNSLTKEVLGKAVKQVQSMFWGQSSYAVIFCVARDYFKYGDNLSLFEEEMDKLSKVMHLNYPCPQNTLISSFYNNSYLRMHVDKWESLQVKPRSVLLAKAFINAVNDILNE